MTAIIDILNDLSSTTKRTEKLEILESVKGTAIEPLFKQVCKLTYDESIDFYIKEFDLAETHHDVIPMSEALTDLHHMIAGRHFTGNMAKSWVELTHENLSEDNATVFNRVIKRDLRCGVSSSTINKVWPNLIYIHPYMRCSSFGAKNLAKISFPCYSQTKMDGQYIDIVVDDDGKVEYRTRSGSYLTQLNDDVRDGWLSSVAKGFVLQGEALALDEDGSLMERSASNGYVNSLDCDVERVQFYIWDVVAYDDFALRKSNVPYAERLYKMIGLVDNLRVSAGEDEENWIQSVDTRVCTNQDDIIEHFKDMREIGEEGTVIKDQDGKWAHGTSKHQVKCKVIFDCELRVVGWKYGEGKYEGKLGALQCESECGQLSVSIGGGFKMAEREKFLDHVDDWVSTRQVITVRANDVVQNKADPDKRSLFLPRFVEVRKDKTEADDLDRINEQVKAFTDALQMIK